MSSRKKARLAFACALALLFSCGTAGTFAITRLLISTKWIARTYDVQVTLGTINSTLSAAARARTAYLNSGDTSFLTEYNSAKTETHDQLAVVHELIRDNPQQVALAKQMDDLVLRRIELYDTSIEIRGSGPLDEATQTRLSRENVSVASDFADVMEAMMEQERNLLRQRREVSSALFATTLAILIATFALSILLFWIHFRLLNRELAEREVMQDNARRVSARILEMQDEERRKFSRELHDSLGQLLSMAKMQLYSLLEKNPDDELLVEIDKLLDQSVSETRTISHLLHPPLLDEMGLASAMRWYLEGFARRSGIQVSMEIAEDVGRTSRGAELALFRVLQESLTNIHRHARSARAEVSLGPLPGLIVLRIRDYGRGMPRETLQTFQKSGGRVGVGLAGMRERIREHGGKFEIQSDQTGTTVSVMMPVDAAENTAIAPLAASAD